MHRSLRRFGFDIRRWPPVVNPAVAVGDVVIIDDYGHHQGCRKAVDEYFADTPVLLHRIDYCGRMFVKR